MPAWPLRSRSRLFRVGALCLVALAHLAAFELLQPKIQPAEPDAPPPPPEMTSLPVRLQPPPPRDVRPSRQRKSKAEKETRPSEAPAPPIRFRSAPAARNAPATAPGGASASASGAAGPPKVVWGETGGVQPFLRGSVGCDYDDVKLSKLEREHCAEHAGRQARKGPVIGPAGDDPRRAAQLAADADFNNRINHWKSGYGGSSNGKCLHAVVGGDRPGYRDIPPTPGGPAQPPVDPCD